MLGLLQSFTAVLDEFGVSNGRAKRAARCAAEGLMRVCIFYLMYYFVQTDLIACKAGQVLKLYSAAAVNEMIASVQAYNDSVKTAKWLVHPLAHLHSPEIPAEHADEVCRTSGLHLGSF
jgi:nuclear cap-binding protein subunit 1